MREKCLKGGPTSSQPKDHLHDSKKGWFVRDRREVRKTFEQKNHQLLKGMEERLRQLSMGGGVCVCVCVCGGGGGGDKRLQK